MDAGNVLSNVAQVAESFAEQRRERQVRRHLDPADFQALADAGYLLVAVPEPMGGIWADVRQSTGSVCEILRTLAHGDPSVALVSAMHPAVLGFWFTRPEAPAPYTKAWQEQRKRLFQTALDRHSWGTVTSEPGSGGDVTRSRARAEPQPDGSYKISGPKHFGSGSGITSYMLTSAVPDGETDADFFFLDVRGVPWDGSTGMRLVQEWDGHGMTATQSHAFELTDFPAERIAWPGSQAAVTGVAGAFFGALFTAVIVGTAESAFQAAQSQIARKKDNLRAYEQVEWARAENEFWLIQQAYQAMLRLIGEKGGEALLDSQHAKLAISELCESLTLRICRVVGGGSFHRSSHFGAAFEDVRALGFLRPPWALAYDQLLAATWRQLEGS